MTVPAVALILTVFVGMLALTRVKVPLGVALALGGITLAICVGMPVRNIGINLGKSLLQLDLWLLMIVIVMITEIARFMTRGDNARRIVSVISSWGGRHGRAWSLMAAPAIVGLLPMPGGALFSAPLVQQAACDHDDETEGSYPPEWKAALNHWFRHIWEFWWPLYPGVLFALSMFKIETHKFIAAMIIFTPVAAGAGYVTLVRPYLGRLQSSEPAPEGDRDARTLLLLLPLLIVVLAAVLLPKPLGIVIPALGDKSHKLLAMMIGLVIGLALTRYFERDKPGKLSIRAMLDKKSRNILLTILGIFVFQYMLRQTGLVRTACEEMRDWGFPAAVAVAALPALAGLVTGVAAAFAAVSFPLVIELMEAPGSGLYQVSTIILAYAAGYIGMMLSPVHLCVVVTNDFFSSSVRKSLLKLFPCALVVMSVAVVLFVVLNSMGI